MKVTQLYLTLCDPVDYTVHGILQARILEWVSIPFSRRSSQPRGQTQVSHITGRFDISWVTGEAQRVLLKGRLKSRDITLLAKVHIVKTMCFFFFPVVIYGCESWTIKKAEHWRIDVFELWCWRRLLRVPWIARKSNWSILKEIIPEYSLKGLMLKLKLQSFGHLMQRSH